MRSRSLAVPTVVAAAVVALAGCKTSTSPGGGGGLAGHVTVGNLFFQSAHNGSMNPAVDTVAIGDTVTWTWSESGTPHSVASTGTPSFTSQSGTSSTNGFTYKVKFTAAGPYAYNCSVHPTTMTGRIVVR
ncbi:MAG TPA: plastocyanin/azurin family copper-binding protein [Gemmatimonadales bacterium]|nr:plastocyanin/azurin family copper-binding protein [Gemmatimonadales bacterium]